MVLLRVEEVGGRHDLGRDAIVARRAQEFSVGVAGRLGETPLLVAVVVLPLPIIIGYGIRAAEREDRTAV